MDPNQKLTGLASMGGQPPMGAPGMGGPPPRPMGPPPGMGGPPSPKPMGPPSAPMGPAPGMGELAMEGQPPMDEPSADPQQDAMMLTEAVISQTRGNVDAAINLLDTAKGMLMQAAGGGQDPMMSGGQDPMMANMGRPIMMNEGGPLKAVPSGNKGLGSLPQNVRNKMGYMNMGGPLYRQEGGTMSDTDMLRQMIMDGLAQSGRAVSDKDKMMANQIMQKSGRTMSDTDMMKTIQQSSPKGQSNSTSKAMDELNKFRYGG